MPVFQNAKDKEVEMKEKKLFHPSDVCYCFIDNYITEEIQL